MNDRKKSLTKLAECLPAGHLKGNGEISGLCADSRQVKPGDLFVCIPGFSVDGHDFAEQVQERGAAALLVERFLPVEIPQLQTDSVRQTVGLLAAAFYGEPSSHFDLVGVTGTNGKTTVTHLIERIACQGSQKTGLIGTLGAKIGGVWLPGERTTPEAVDLQQLFAEMLVKGAQTVVMEVSSHALALGRVNGSVFDSSVFTNLTQDHLDFHQTMECYLKAKARLFTHLTTGSSPLAVINTDQVEGRRLSSMVSYAQATYGLENQQADYVAADIQLSSAGVRFQVIHQGSRAEVFYATPGKFSVYNALAAWAWGDAKGYDPEVMRRALAEGSGVPGRFESVRQGQPFQVIVDYAHTPDGLENVLKTAREITTGKLITVFGCGGDRDRSKRPLMGTVAARWSDLTLVTSDNPRTEEPEAVIADILPGLAAGATREVIPERKTAIRRACSLAKPGDTVLIAGKGHEDYQIIGQKKIHFDDREEAREALRSRGYGDE